MGRKLSQLSTDECLDLLCAATPYVMNIVSDEELTKTIGKAIKTENMTRAGVLIAGAEKLSSLVPIIAKTHRSDLYGIVAAVNNVEPEKIAKQNVIHTGIQIRDIIKDKELMSFFRSFAESEETAS